jgi:hypothetical protein
LANCADEGKLNLSYLVLEGYLAKDLAFEWEANLELPAEFLGSERVILGERFVVNDTTGELTEIRKGAGEVGLDSPLLLVREGEIRYRLQPRILIDSSLSTCRGIKFKAGDIATSAEGIHTIIFEWDGTNRTIDQSYNYTYGCNYIDYEIVKVTVR